MQHQYISRPLYLDRIKAFSDTNLVKVLVGQRRVGKSYLLFQIMDFLLDQAPDRAQIYVNKERHEFSHIRTGEDLIEYVEDQAANGKAAVLIDEIQDIDGFERALRHFHAVGRFDVYCTGSNANLLAGELATFLTGRYVEIRIYGLSYAEFMRFHTLKQSPRTFQTYLRYGGLPYLTNLELTDPIALDYLRTVIDSILLKDVVARYNVRNVNFLKRLTQFVADNVGSLVSAKKISDYLKSQQVRMSHNLVLDYLEHLSNALIAFKVQRVDLIGKRIFEIGEKYYFQDLGLRHALIGYRAADINKILENIVYLHLLIAGYSVNVGRIGDAEVDFVCNRDGERLYVQVAYLITDEKVRKREFGNLARISDNHPKVVVSMDPITGDDEDGISHLHVEEFLLKLVPPGLWAS
jgi:predicted AAA+ superfamily ATPase